MNKRLKIIAILLGLVYCFAVVNTIISEWDSFRAGFNEGREDAKNMFAHKSFFIDIEPKTGIHTFPNSLLDNQTGKMVLTEFGKAQIKVQDYHYTLWDMVIMFVISIVAVVVMLSLLIIPFMLFKILRSVIKNDVFDTKNIKRFQWIGYIVLAFFAGEMMATLYDYWAIKNQIDFETYKIVFNFDGYMYLFLGFGTLLFAEILRISTQMKEDIDLTV